MKKTRIVGRISAGAIASAVLLTGALASPAQAAKDTGWPMGVKSDSGATMLKDTRWPMG